VRPRQGLQDLLLDAKFGLRQLRRAPLTTAVAVLTLAIGIGMNTAVFTLVNAVLLRQLPYPDSDRLVWIAPYDNRFGQDTFASRADYVIWKQQTHVFEKMAAYGTQDLAIVIGDEATQERVASIGGDFWTITGAQPALGRLSDEGDEGTIVLSHGLFERRFGGQSAVIGQVINVSGTAFTVTGVLPQGFRVTFPQQTAPGDELRDLDAFISLPRGQETPGDPIVQTNRPTPPWVRVVAKLGAGIDLSRAQAEMEAVHGRLQRAYPSHPRSDRSIRVLSLKDKVTEQARLSLIVLLGAVSFVLFIAATNVANLLLMQASIRAKETAVRTAMGASRGRLLRQFFVEGVLLALIAGSVGVLMAYTAVPLLISMSPVSISAIADIGVDGRVLWFTLLISVATGLVFSWAPMFGTSRLSVLTTLSGTTHSITPGGTRLQGLLISVEVALAVVLLTGAGLMVKSLWRLHSYPAGFSPQGTYTMRIPLSGPRYEAFDQKIVYINELLARLEAAAGVEAAGISASTYNLPVTVTGSGRLATDSQPFVAVRMVSPAYLRAMGVSLVRGRWPGPDDALDTMVVNETFARSVSVGDVLGRAISGSFVSGTIVGVVADFPYARLDGQPMPELYYPYQRAPATRAIAVAVRMSESAVGVVRQLIEDVDRTQPVYQFRALEQALSESVAPRRFNMFLLQAFAVSAVLMALVGTFGVVARSVSRRRRETALRIAVGAQPVAVIFMIARQAMTYVLGGVVVGVGVAVVAGQTMRSMLHGVEPNDPVTIAMVAISLGVAAFTACWLPAVKAARVDPAIVLRHE
jgi:putative ABC transport system permease protein